MEQGHLTFAPQHTIEVVKENSEALQKMKKQEEKLVIQSETIMELKTEVEELKSLDTAIVLYHQKYQEERQQKEQHAQTIRAQAKTQD